MLASICILAERRAKFRENDGFDALGCAQCRSIRWSNPGYKRDRREMTVHNIVAGKAGKQKKKTPLTWRGLIYQREISVQTPVLCPFPFPFPCSLFRLPSLRRLPSLNL